MPSPHEERRESQAPYYPVSTDPNAPETEPLTGPTSDATTDNGAMGNEEQLFVKSEARRGDQTALIAAIVSSLPEGRSSRHRLRYVYTES